MREIVTLRSARTAPFDISIRGNATTGTMLLFVHGPGTEEFGSAHGMLRALTAEFGEPALVVAPALYVDRPHPTGNDGLGEQVERLALAYSYVAERFDISATSVVAQGQGAFVAAVAELPCSHWVFLSPQANSKAAPESMDRYNALLGAPSTFVVAGTPADITAAFGEIAALSVMPSAGTPR